MFVHSLVKFGVKSGGLFLTDKANGAEIWPVSTFTTSANKHNKRLLNYLKAVHIHALTADVRITFIGFPSSHRLGGYPSCHTQEKSKIAQASSSV